MISGQFSHHSLDLTIIGNRTVDHVVKDFGHIGAKFKITGFFYLFFKNFIFAHSGKIRGTK